MKSLSIIIPNWNGEKQLAENLPQLFKVLKKFKNKNEVIIIDDASSDNSISLINCILETHLSTHKNKSSYKTKVKVIKNKSNLGFAKTVNKGIRAAKYKIVFTLNTDVKVKEKCFDYILTHFENRSVFAVGANHDWQVGIGDFIYYPGDYFGLTKPVKPKSKPLPQPALWVCGGNSAFDRQKWLKLGGLDSSLFKPFYFEEIDLCYRAWKRGYKVIWEPKANVEHFHEKGVIFNNFDKNYIALVFNRNQLIFTWKNITQLSLLIKHIFCLIKKIIKDPIYLKVIFFAIAKLPEIIKKRKVELKESKYTDQTILSMFEPNYRFNLP